MTPRILLLLVLASGLAAAAPSHAFGQDDKGKKGEKDDKDGKGKKGDGKGDGGDKKGKDGDKKDGKGEKDPKDDAEEERRRAERAYAAAVAREFEAKDAGAITARIAEGAKLTIRIGKTADGQFAATQAKGVLADWFKERGDITLKLKSLKDSVGIFDMTVRSGDKSRSFELHVQIRARGKGYVLERIEKFDL
jgi:hypothetical protein